MPDERPAPVAHFRAPGEDSGNHYIRRRAVYSGAGAPEARAIRSREKKGRARGPPGREEGMDQKWSWTPPKISRSGPGWYELPSGSGSVKAMYFVPPRLRAETMKSVATPAIRVL